MSHIKKSFSDPKTPAPPTLALAGCLFVALVGCLLAAACGETKAPSGPVSYAIADPTGDWGYPSPYAHYSRGPGYVRMSFVFDTLVWKDADGFIPALAEEWEYVEAENAYVFKLQENATWHDGERFTAEDVAFTLDYTKQHPYQWVDPSIVRKAEVIDEHTVKLHLEEPYAPFLQDVADTLPILPKHIWEGVDDPEKLTGPEAVVGTGPYKLADYSKEHGTYLYQAYDQYYLGKPEVDSLKFVKVGEEMAPASLKQGSVNAGSIPPEVAEDMSSSGFALVQAPYAWNAKLMINHTKEPLSFQEFRQALAYAIDREALVEITQRGHAMAGSPGIIPPDSEWHNPDIQMYNHDPAKAQQLLESLGYELEDGNFTKDGEQLKLELITQTSFKAVGQFIKQQLEEIGIRVDFSTFEAKTVDAKVQSWQFDLSVYGHGGLYEPSILNRVITGKGFNSARYDANEALNQLLAAQLAEMEHERRKALVAEVQEVYAEELPALTLYYPDWYWAHDGSVELYYTKNGIASGVPIPLNKMAFMEYKGK